MQTLADFVFDFFRLCKKKPMKIREGIWQVQVDDKLAKELDGWRAKGGLLQFTFDRKLAETYGAELICQSSYRLDSIVRLVQKQAILSHGTLPEQTFHEPAIRKKILDRLGAQNPSRLYVVNCQCKYGPYLWMILRLSFLAYEKHEEMRKPLVDLVTGKVVTYEVPTHLIRQGAPPPSREIFTRRLSYKQAYGRIQDELNSSLTHSDHSWAKDALTKLEQERDRLEDYYKDHDDADERARRLGELFDRAKPRVQVRPLRGSLLYLPKFAYRIVKVTTNEQMLHIVYDPFSGQMDMAP